MINAGDLNQRVTIEKLVDGPGDAYNDPKPGSRWVKVVELPAKVDNPTGQEIEYARSYSTTISYRITTRYYPGLSQLMRIKFDSRTLAINAILVDDRKTELTFLATEDATTAVT